MFGYKPYALLAQASAPVPAPPPAAAPEPRCAVQGGTFEPEKCTVAREIVTGVGGTAFGGAVAWMGIRSGLVEKGGYSVLGWTVGIAGGLFGLWHAANALGIWHKGPGK